jgi:hypothetical protein
VLLCLPRCSVIFDECRTYILRLRICSVIFGRVTNISFLFKRSCIDCILPESIQYVIERIYSFINS